MSQFPRRPRTTSTGARCWKPSIFRSVSRVIAHGQDEYAHAREETPQDSEEIRYATRRAQGADPRPEDRSGGAGGGAGRAAEAAAGCGRFAAAQSLLHHRPFAWRVPQVWIGA